MDTNRPGSAGEHALQERYGSFKRAAAFYDKQMLDHLNPLMREYLARQEMVFIATADASGECDCSFRAGPPGFVRVLDDRTVMYAEYRGNGVMASLGNVSETGQIGMFFADFFHSGVGMHINGHARIVERGAVEAFAPLLQRITGDDVLHETYGGRTKTPERWVVVEIVEAYIHCSKHIPMLAHLPGNIGQAAPSGDYFEAKDDVRPWVAPEEPAPAASPSREPEPATTPSPAAARAIVAGPEAFLDSEEPDEPAAFPEAETAEHDTLIDAEDAERVGSVLASAAPPEQETDAFDYLLPPAWDWTAPR
ncbi:MAG TPA: pyridoxamine 5'-phosphate oxidase family protein [Solirubrobacteraceae bacterium]|jgi:hypothetical protein